MSQAVPLQLRSHLAESSFRIILNHPLEWEPSANQCPGVILLLLMRQVG